MPMKDAVLQVRLWNEDLSGWRVLPLAGRGKPGVAPGVQARVTAEEGYGECSLPLYGTLADFEGIAVRRRVELFAVWPEGEALLYRGYIRRISPTVADGGKLALLVKCLGRYADVARANARKKYIKAGQGVDRSEIFADLMSRFVLPASMGDPPRIGGPTILYNDSQTGDLINRLEAVRVGTALDTLAKGGKRVARGCDVESGSGDDRSFFHLFDDPAIDSPKHIIPVPGKQVGQRQREQDDTRQITEFEILGGTLENKNLLADYVSNNTDFESPKVPDETAVNVLLNASFENTDLFGAPDDWTTTTIAGGGPNRTGSNGVALSGAISISQTVNPAVSFPIRPGDNYGVGGWGRTVDSAHPSNLGGALHWLDSGGATISTYTFGPSGAGFGPLSPSWRRYEGFSVAPAGATGYTIVFESSNANTVRLDDVFLYNASLLLPDGWRIGTTGSGKVVYNGAYEGDAWEGGYSLYLEVSGSPNGTSDRVYIAPGLDTPYRFTPGQEYVFCVRYASPGAGAPDLQVRYQTYDSGGGTAFGLGITYTGGVFAGWKYAEYRNIFPTSFGGETVRLFFDLVGNGTILLDAVVFVVAEALPPVDSGDMQPRFWPGSTYRRTFRADELFESGPVYDAAVAIQGGAGLPGPYDSETRQEVVDEDGGETYARAVFTERTPVVERPDLETFGVIDTNVGGSTATMMPGELVRLIGPGGRDILPTPLPCAEKLIRWDKGMLTITPYLQTAPADAARTIGQIVQDALQRYGQTQSN